LTTTRVAVVTPYHNEKYEILKRCHDSVASQDYGDVTHMFIADGLPHPCLKIFANIEHMILPVQHADAGATPRAIGAISAFSRGYDAVAFLDADNTFCTDHVSTMVDTMRSTGAAIVTATRNICTESGDHLYVDDVESNGRDFCDTNCMFIGKPALHLLTYWITESAMRLWSDRQFWASVIQSNMAKHHVPTATVNYHSRWAWHYQHAGKTPPPHSVWIDRTVDGRLVHKQHSEL
jgi:glycosyltransferase involved in cell wall biosynthesis